MTFVRFPNCGAAGVLKDLSKHDIPQNAWTDASNMRFLDGYIQQFLGHGAAYGTPPIIPYHVLPVNVGSTRYWLYAGAQKIFAVSISGGSVVHTNLTRQTAGVDVNYTGVPNQWTSTLLSGIPIFNAGNTVDPPQRWDLNIANRMVTLDNWPANTYCKALRTFKNFLIALNVTKGSQNFPFMVKWSSPADPGGVPLTWNPADQTQDAGEADLAESNGAIIDGLQLRDVFMIYKEDSVWRMTYTGGQYVFAFQKVLGVSGALNRNCIVEVDGFHFVLTGSDVIVHDGQNSTSILDKQARRALFQDFDVSAIDRAFVVKNPFLNEVMICYPQAGNSIPNKALVWNYRDKTVSYRDMPSVHHANYGAVDSALGDTWDSDGDPWNSDLTLWNGPDFTPNTTRVLMASELQKLYLLDTSASFDGVKPTCYVERVGLDFGEPEKKKLVTGVRLRVVGGTGDTITVKVGASDDPYVDPAYSATLTHTIGQTVACDCFVSGRYIAIRIESGSAYFARIDSFDIEVLEEGDW
jgi:hypothetical protein